MPQCLSRSRRGFITSDSAFEVAPHARHGWGIRVVQTGPTAKNNLCNFATNANRREDFVVGIGYDDSISEAQEIARKVSDRLRCASPSPRRHARDRPNQRATRARPLRVVAAPRAASAYGVRVSP